VIVVSDTSPLNYLVLIGQLDLLPRLFGVVYTVPAVIAEMQHLRAPLVVRAWALHPPAWLRVQAPVVPIMDSPAGRGEAEAMALAQELRADVVLIDDGEARHVAESMGLIVRGTLAVLDLAAEEGLIDPLPVLDQLKATSFRAREERWRYLREKYRKP
jgi:predicted nucleic acid-binding protein